MRVTLNKVPDIQCSIYAHFPEQSHRSAQHTNCLQNSHNPKITKVKTSRKVLFSSNLCLNNNMDAQTPKPTTPQVGYKIRGTKVISSYPVKLTPAETRLVFSLQRHFSPENILADYYAAKVNFRSQYAADQTNFTLNACRKHLAGSATVQIDALAINTQGIFVFESKDFSGWIYGDEHSKNWTQVLNFGREKHQFYNPIRQNLLHLQAIQDFLGSQFSFYSIIVFGNQATLKITHPTSTNTFICTQSQLSNILAKCQTAQKLTPTQIAQILTDLKNHCVPPDTLTRQAHLTETQAALTEIRNYSQ